MDIKKYEELKQTIKLLGYQNEIDWYNKIANKNTFDGLFFRDEVIYVIINSGMKQQVAAKIFEKVKLSIETNKPILDVYKHQGKVKAINFIKDNYFLIFLNYSSLKTDEEKLQYLETIPFIGKITKYHLAKNLGLQVVKPDRHLVRIASMYNTTPEQMCKNISEQVGDLISVVDLVIWRAANLGLI